MRRCILDLSDLKVSDLQSIISLPRWKEQGNAGKNAQKAWTDFMGALTVHEGKNKPITKPRPAMAGPKINFQAMGTQEIQSSIRPCLWINEREKIGHRSDHERL